MKQSPLQIEHYFVSDLHFAVNPSFDINKPAELNDDQFVVESILLHDEKCAEKWQVTLKIKHHPSPEANAPYSITLELVGYFNVIPSFDSTKAERLVKTNGSSMLFGIAREVVRTVTASGPHRGMLLPSVSFYEPLPKTGSAVSQGEEPAKA